MYFTMEFVPSKRYLLQARELYFKTMENKKRRFCFLGGASYIGRQVSMVISIFISCPSYKELLKNAEKRIKIVFLVDTFLYTYKHNVKRIYECFITQNRNYWHGSKILCPNLLFERKFPPQFLR